jgi:hypothetical protein
MRPIRLVTTAMLLAAVLAGCATGAGAPSTEATDSARPTRSAPAAPITTPSDEPMTGEVPAEIMASLLVDAATRAGVAENAIEVVRAEATTWNDGSLGCPEPGMGYTMALVDGYHVVLEVDGEELDYRVSGNGGFRLCESGGRPGG